MTQTVEPHASDVPAIQIGDVLLIATSDHSAAHPDRGGEVLAIHVAAGRTYYRVRWPNGSVSVLDEAAARPERRSR